MDMLSDIVSEIVESAARIKSKSSPRRAIDRDLTILRAPVSDQSEYVTTADATETKRTLSSRKQQAGPEVRTKRPTPAAPNVNATTNDVVESTANLSSRRKAIVSQKPMLGAPSAAHSKTVTTADPEMPSKQSLSRKRRANTTKKPNDEVPAALNSDDYSPVDAQAPTVIRDDDALAPAGTQRPCPPVVVNLPAPVGGDERAQSTCVFPEAHSPFIPEIVQLWRMRQRWHRAEKSLTLQGRALCRSWTAGDKDAANKLFDLAESGAEVDPSLATALLPFFTSIEAFRPLRAATERDLRKLAKRLPVWAWASQVRGFGDLNLAAIVGESGDIGSYRNPSCLWKRMGLAVIDGGRQRKVANAEEALAHGYNPARRAVAYLLGDTLIKGNRDGQYRALYLARKERELARGPDDNPPKSQAHAHNRAARTMTKEALKDLWVAWRSQ